MTDQIPADLSKGDVEAARDWVSHVLSQPPTYLPMLQSVARVLNALLPPPPLPTMADMNVEERDECQWMQCDTETRGRAVIIAPNLSGGRVALLDRWGDVFYESHTTVAPRPDLPRMEWPGDTPTPAVVGVPPNTLEVGSVWGDRDALARACHESERDQIVITDKDGDAFTWSYDNEWWENGTLLPEFGPYTIIYIGRKADQ